jgi:hypothetical protein
MRGALQDAIAERDAIIKEGGGTPAGALAWLQEDPDLESVCGNTPAEIGAGATVIADLDAYLAADDRDQTLVQLES